MLRQMLGLQVGRLIQFATSFLTGVIVARELTSHEYGLLAVAAAIGTGIAAVVELGTEESLERNVDGKTSVLVVLRFRILLLAVVGCLSFLLICIVFTFSLGIASTIFGTSLSLLSFTSTWLVVSFRTLRACLILIGGALAPGLAYVLGLHPHDVLSAAMLSSLCGYTSFVLAFVTRPPIKETTSTGGSRRWLDFINVDFSVANALSLVLGKQSDIFTLTAVGVSAAAVGRYSFGYSLPAIVSTVLLAGLGPLSLRWISTGRAGSTDRSSFTGISSLSFALSGPPLLGLCIFSAPIIRLIYGMQFLAGEKYVVIFSCGSMISRFLGGGTAQAILYKHRRERVSVIIRCSLGLVFVLIGLIGAILIGPTAVAVSTACSSIAVTVAENVAASVRLAWLPWRDTYVFLFGAVLMSFAAAVVGNTRDSYEVISAFLLIGILSVASITFSVRQSRWLSNKAAL